MDQYLLCLVPDLTILLLHLVRQVSFAVLLIYVSDDRPEHVPVEIRQRAYIRYEHRSTAHFPGDGSLREEVGVVAKTGAAVRILGVSGVTGVDLGDLRVEVFADLLVQVGLGFSKNLWKQGGGQVFDPLAFLYDLAVEFLEKESINQNGQVGPIIIENEAELDVSNLEQTIS